MLTLADVLVDQIHTLAVVLAGVAMTLIELVLTAVASVAGITVTGEDVYAVHAGAMVARVRLAIVNVALAEGAFVPFGASALISVGSVIALGAILAGRTGALVNVDLTHGAGEPWLAGTGETVDHVPADTVVHARIAITLIHIHLAVGSHVARHADAGELPNAVQTGGIVVTGHRQAFIYVYLAPRASIATAALALERALRVHTLPEVFAGVGANGTLIHILVAGSTHKASGAGTDGTAIQRVGVTNRALIAWVTDAGVIQMTEQTRLSHGTLAEEGGNAVMAGSPIEAHGGGTIIYVLTAVVAGPAVDAHACVAADCVKTGTTIVASVGLHQAFIHVLSTVLTCPFRWALAVVCVYTVHT